MQRDNSFGELLFRLRERKGVSQSRLCRGLCSVSALSRYERGERAPHMLLFNALMQRLGASVVSLNAVISIREYHYLSWKGQILQAARENRIRTVQELLEDPVSPGEVGDRALQEQFLYVMQSFLQERQGKDAESMELLKKAASLTVPVDRVPFRELLLSAGETFILVKLSDLLVKNGEKAQAGKLLWELIGYLERNVEDEMRSILYPQVVRILAPLLLEERRFSECGQLCRKAIEMLRDTGHLADMEGLLSCYLRCDCQGEYADRCRKWLWTVREIFRRYPVEKNNSIFPCQWEQELYLIQEMIRAYRVMDGLSQEEMSGLLFSPETLSRAENGKHTLHTEHYFAVRERLSVEEEFINPRLHTRDYFILEKMQKVYRAISTTRYEDAKRELAQVRASLEKSGELSDEYNSERSGDDKCYHSFFFGKNGKERSDRILRKIPKVRVSGYFRGDLLEPVSFKGQGGSPKSHRRSDCFNRAGKGGFYLGASFGAVEKEPGFTAGQVQLGHASYRQSFDLLWSNGPLSGLRQGMPCGYFPLPPKG